MRGPFPLQFPVPTQGVVANVPVHEIPPNALAPQSFNVYVDLDGLLKARNGYSPVPSDGSGLNPPDYPLGLISFHNAADQKYYTVMQGIATWQFFNGSDWTNITSATNPTTGSFDVQAQFSVLFQNGVSTVYGTNGINQLRSWTPGQATYQVVGAAPATALDIEVIAGRVVAAGITNAGMNFPYRVQWSAVNDGTTWPIGASDDLQGSTREMTFVVAIKAMNRLNAAIYKEDSVWIMTAQPGVDQTAFSFELASNTVGVAGPCNSSCIVPFGGIHYYLGRDFRIWTFDGITAQPISRVIDSLLINAVNPNFPGRFSGAYLPSKQQIWWFFTPIAPVTAPYFK